ncbi:3TM-type holin [Sphingomonas sp.]|jgi:hypothetical protein|uniref:3TM-type holin n=1 Tax=Sphingomonas sp. TaxID=28214 RepID=UPI00356A3A01
MALDPLTAILDIGGKIIDKVFPDPVQRDAARLAMLQAQQRGELEEVNVRLSAIMAEAKSTDPWTSRARPSFLYVVYILILTAIPMGILSAFSAETAAAIAAGFKAWLASIPPDIVELFQWVMLGYIGGRSFEKVKGAAK